MLQVLLYAWKGIVPHVVGVSQPFEMKMLTMVGMGILTVIVFFISRVGKTHLSVWSEKWRGVNVAVVLLSSLLLISTAVCFTHGVHGWGLMVYGSLVTPLFEELLFRGHIYDIQQHIHRRPRHVPVANALLFSVWHLGYIVQPLWCGEWMALSKLVVALFYGLALAYIRQQTKSTLCCILVHGALNSFLG